MKMFQRTIAALGVAAAAALAGCSTTSGRIKIEPLTPKYETSSVVNKADRPQQKLLRIGQFVDKRPDEEKEGNEPGKWYLLIYNWRRGTYVTSDEAWKDGTVPEHVTKALVDGMKDTNLFEEVKAEATAEPTGGSGYILTGTIDTFVSEQKVSFNETILYDNEKKWSPRGRCKLTVTLTDAETGQKLIDAKPVTGESNSNKLNITENGSRALSTAVTLLGKDITKTLSSF